MSIFKKLSIIVYTGTGIWSY